MMEHWGWSLGADVGRERLRWDGIGTWIGPGILILGPVAPLLSMEQMPGTWKHYYHWKQLTTSGETGPYLHPTIVGGDVTMMVLVLPGAASHPGPMVGCMKT